MEAHENITEYIAQAQTKEVIHLMGLIQNRLVEQRHTTLYIHQSKDCVTNVTTKETFWAQLCLPLRLSD